MIERCFVKYIVLVSSVFFIGTSAMAQVPSGNPVVPVPLKNIPLDSAAILQAKYDSLINHMIKVYGLDADSSDAIKGPEIQVPLTPQNTITTQSTAVFDSIRKAQSLLQQPDLTPSTVDTLLVADTIAKANITPTQMVSLINPTETQGLTPLSPPIKTVQIQVADTPRIKPILPVINTPSPDTLEIDEISSEELLVDTLEADSMADFADGDEADAEGEAEGEFDNLFTGYSDVSYWDMLRDPNFKFDQQMIPADTHYPFAWDTVVINPYKVSLVEMNDTILLKLKDSMDCSFHPPAIGDLTSGFGFRRWGKRPKFHYGVDVRMEVGDPVYAIFDGIVRVAKRSSDYGYVVLIRHYNGLETLYAHFDQLLAYPGKPVRSGEIIGLSGNTGRSTGPHLHFEVRFKGEKIDPSKVIYFPSGSLLSDTLQIDKHCFNHLKLYKAQQTKLRSRYYVVKRGDTLGKIAYKNGVTVKQIARLNKVSHKTKLKAGRRLRIR
jgi:murein DD-endopeptidase MepM/ murein hydrolase activator NlpD